MEGDGYYGVQVEEGNICCADEVAWFGRGEDEEM